MARTTNPASIVPWDEFVLAWQTSKDIDEVKTLLDLPDELPNAKVSSRASFFRQQGIDLKMMRVSRNNSYDYDEIGRYANWVTEQAASGATDLSLERFRAGPQGEQQQEEEVQMVGADAERLGW